MRLIDLDSDYIQETLYRRAFKTRQDIEDWLNSAPTIDAVPVVRCQDCEYFRTNDENVPYCLNPFGLDDPEPNGFCNYGREKDAIEAWNRRAGEEDKHGIETD